MMLLASAATAISLAGCLQAPLATAPIAQWPHTIRTIDSEIVEFQRIALLPPPAGKGAQSSNSGD